MSLRGITAWLRRPSVAGALVTALIGLALWRAPLGGGLERLSYDLPTVFSEPGRFPELVLIELDETSHRELAQDYGELWDRRKHAQLVEHLRADGAAVIIFDVEFQDAGDDPAANAELAAALRAHGSVVLAAPLVHIGKPGFGGTQIMRPLPELLGPGVTWGVSWSLPGPQGEEDGTVRRHPAGRDPDFSLPWVAAAAANATVTQSAARPGAERWVRHYGPGSTLPRVSYWQATNEAPGFYSGKTVFIGGRPGTGFVRQEGDQFRTPWSRAGSAVSGLELTATAWLNLVRGDWLTRASPAAEVIAMLLFGAVLGGLVARWPLWRAGVTVLLAAGAAFAAGLWLFWSHDLWWNWAVPALVQAPAAFAWCGLMSFTQLSREKEWLEAPLKDLFPDSPADTDAQAVPIAGTHLPETTAMHAAAGNAALIPDYELLRCVGRGAYGEVWLARDVLGGFRAVKIVRRVVFEDDTPYEREFHGLQKFAPVSRQHPGLVQVLHVGLNREAGFFYYVMETGDDERTGQRIDPDTYRPRSLGNDLRAHGPRPRAETVRIGLALCEALEFLHGQGLIHRDLKPANVIFAEGRPKLADVGLVTELSSQVGAVTQVGTKGFMPPEGPGTAAGDVYALGRLLEVTLGIMEEFSTDDPALASLGAIIQTACAADPAARTPTARALREALLAWQNKYLPAEERNA